MTKLLQPYGNSNVEYSSNTRNLRRLRRRRKFDVEYTLILRWKVVIRWTGTFQSRINVDIHPAIGKVDFLRRIGFYVKKHVSDNVYFSTSNPRRFNVDVYPAIRCFLTLSRRRFYVEKYRCGQCIFFNVKSTSIQSRNFPIHQACWFINVEYTWIIRRGFLTVAKGTSSGTLRSLLCPFLPSLALWSSGVNW